MKTRFFIWKRYMPSLDLAFQPISSPSSHASLGAENVKLVDTTSLSSDGLSRNELPTHLTAHVQLPDETHYLAKYIIISNSRGDIFGRKK